MAEPRQTVERRSLQSSEHGTRTRILTDSILDFRARLDEAIQLVELGARAGLVTRLTRLDKTTVARLFWEIRNESPSPGQLPYTDRWFRREQRRMAHASLVWCIHCQLRPRGLSDAALVIKTHEAYGLLARKPFLDVMRTALVPQLVANGSWVEATCTDCDATFVKQADSEQYICQGCYIYYRHRCSQCDTPTNAEEDETPASCKSCGARRIRGAWIPAKGSTRATDTLRESDV